MATRYNINDFALANPIYVGGTVSFYTVSGGAKTTTLATLYAASTGSTTLANPRTLDSDGKFSVPVYTEVPVIATVSGLTIADHDTGIMGLAEGAASTSATSAAASASAASASQTASAASAVTAAAAVSGIGHRAAATVGGTVDAITATFSPVFASLAASAGIVLAIPLAGANTSTTPTLAIDGFTAKTIVTGSGSAMVAGAIPGGDFVGLFVYDASADKFQMLNPSGGVTTGDIIMSGAMIVEAEGAAVASAASCNIWATDGNTCHITGTTQIDDFATAPQAGAWKKVIFDDALILNQSATLNLNGGGEDITTAAGDMAFIYADTTTQVDVFVVRKSGASVVSEKIVQVVEATPYTTYSSSATAIPYDDTIPQNTEGAEWVTVTITPTSATNRLRIEAEIPQCTSSAAEVIAAAIFQDTTANALAVSAEYAPAGSSSLSLRVSYEMAAGTTSATTFKLRAGSAAGTIYVNGTAAARRFGGVSAIRMRVTEIKV